ncbi:SURF1 family protein [Nocardioides salsibiostraticola]
MARYLTSRLIGATALAIVCVMAAGALGLWQLSAWQAIRTAEQSDLTQSAPVPLTDVMGPDDPFPGRDVGRPVTLSGEWLPASTVFVSGREIDGVEGYWVVTSLAVGAVDDPALPVVRGWVADLEDGPPNPTGSASVETWLQPTEGTGQADDDPSDDVLPQMRTGDLIQRVDQDLYGAYGVSTTPLDGLEPASLEQLPPAGRFTALRNFLYAVEWWIFGAFALFVWWRFVVDETATEQAWSEPVASGS